MNHAFAHSPNIPTCTTEQSNVLAKGYRSITRSKTVHAIIILYSARGSFLAVLFGLPETLYRVHHGVE